MDLLEYVGNFYNQSHVPAGFPDELKLPRNLIDAWYDLYWTGERMGCEFGESLTADRDFHKIKRSDPVKGLADSCSVPRTASVLEFGDMHSHPSFSIGHLDGHSAHSVEDWQVFKYHLNKPVFIRFVASGEFLYAVVYRHGHSQFQEAFLDSMLTYHTINKATYYEKFNPKVEPANPDVVQDLDPRQEAFKIFDQKLKTPGFGRFMMKLARANNFQLASLLKFGFYVGQRNDKGVLRIAKTWQ